MSKEEIKRLIDEFIRGMINCNIPLKNVERMNSVLYDFYHTKIENYNSDEDNNA